MRTFVGRPTSLGLKIKCVVLSLPDPEKPPCKSQAGSPILGGWFKISPGSKDRSQTCNGAQMIVGSPVPYMKRTTPFSSILGLADFFCHVDAVLTAAFCFGVRGGSFASNGMG